MARSCIRLSTVLLGAYAASVIVVRPDGFWDKRVDSCTKSHKEGEVGNLLEKLSFHSNFSYSRSRQFLSSLFELRNLTKRERDW